MPATSSSLNRRGFLASSAAVGAFATSLPAVMPVGQALAQFAPSNRSNGVKAMSTITTNDGTEIFYKDWGRGQPIVFHHGWPLSSDDWDAQMMFFVEQGYRVVGIDRRGHGRSSQVSDGHDMDHYAADAAAVVEHLDLRNAVHIGHSTGGGEVTRYVAWHGKGRVAMMGGAKAHYDSIKAFSETDFNEDLKSIDVPTLVMHGDDDQIVPYKDAALLSVKLLKNGTLKIYPGFPHGMLTTHADVINQDLLAFVRS